MNNDYRDGACTVSIKKVEWPDRHGWAIPENTNESNSPPLAGWFFLLRWRFSCRLLFNLIIVEEDCVERLPKGVAHVTSDADEQLSVHVVLPEQHFQGSHVAVGFLGEPLNAEAAALQALLQEQSCIHIDELVINLLHGISSHCGQDGRTGLGNE